METEITLPLEVPVMTLPNVVFFPQALLPLHIFEQRYREMLRDVLGSNRLFASLAWIRSALGSSSHCIASPRSASCAPANKQRTALRISSSKGWRGSNVSRSSTTSLTG